MRYFLFFIGILLMASLAWVLLPHDKLPYISFPKGAQHNTFGELPIVEMADDGDIYEVDGAEDDQCLKYAQDEKEKLFKESDKAVDEFLSKYKYTYLRKIMFKSKMWFERLDRRVNEKFLSEFYNECLEMKNECLHLEDLCPMQECKDEIKEACKKYQNRIPCFVQDGLVGGIFTCWSPQHGGGIGWE